MRGTVLEGTVIGENHMSRTMQFRPDNLPVTSEGFRVDEVNLCETLEEAIEHCRSRAAVYEWEAERLTRLQKHREAEREQEHFDDVMQAQRDKLIEEEI